jgi:hypothetical protein
MSSTPAFSSPPQRSLCIESKLLDLWPEDIHLELQSYQTRQTVRMLHLQSTDQTQTGFAPSALLPTRFLWTLIQQLPIQGRLSKSVSSVARLQSSFELSKPPLQLVGSLCRLIRRMNHLPVLRIPLRQTTEKPKFVVRDAHSTIIHTFWSANSARHP